MEAGFIMRFPSLYCGQNGEGWDDHEHTGCTIPTNRGSDVLYDVDHSATANAWQRLLRQ